MYNLPCLGLLGSSPTPALVSPASLYSHFVPICFLRRNHHHTFPAQPLPLSYCHSMRLGIGGLVLVNQFPNFQVSPRWRQRRYGISTWDSLLGLEKQMKHSNKKRTRRVSPRAGVRGSRSFEEDQRVSVPVLESPEWRRRMKVSMGVTGLKGFRGLMIALHLRILFRTEAGTGRSG